MIILMIIAGLILCLCVGLGVYLLVGILGLIAGIIERNRQNKNRQ